MSHTDRITAFAAELDRIVDRFRSEFDLPVVSAVGCLQIKQHMLLQELTEPDEE